MINKIMVVLAVLLVMLISTLIVPIPAKAIHSVGRDVYTVEYTGSLVDHIDKDGVPTKLLNETKSVVYTDTIEAAYLICGFTNVKVERVLLSAPKDRKYFGDEAPKYLPLVEQMKLLVKKHGKETVSSWRGDKLLLELERQQEELEFWK